MLNIKRKLRIKFLRILIKRTLIRSTHLRKFYEYEPWGLYHKTYYGRNLWISVISKSVCPWQAFPAQSSVYE